MTDSINLVEKPNMLLLSKELNKKDRNLPAQLLIATEKRRNMPIESLAGKWILKKIRSDFNIHKKYFPENTLV